MRQACFRHDFEVICRLSSFEVMIQHMKISVTSKSNCGGGPRRPGHLSARQPDLYDSKILLRKRFQAGIDDPRVMRTIMHTLAAML